MSITTNRNNETGRPLGGLATEGTLSEKDEQVAATERQRTGRAGFGEMAEAARECNPLLKNKTPVRLR